MNLSLDTILTNARELVSRLRRDDTTADTAVSQAQYVQERILSMKQYGDDLAELNDISSHRPKTAILYNIQKENRLVKQLQQENEELKQLVIEHRSVLEKIMYKYRKDIQQLILMSKEETKAVNIFNTSLAQDIQDKSSKIHEIASVMRHAISIDDTHSASQDERINALLLENRGLKEILAVHETMHRPKPTSTITLESTVAKSPILQTTTTTIIAQENSPPSSSSSSSSSSANVTPDLTTIISSTQQDLPS
ncbi:unnamed protein product [Rotaria socialis]|uniref:FGFR1 oncogene partner 2 homolog n=1 Tax=Rotaria socialis TaxID=392032 RepID=A0A817XB84_9BILA|nr:unnamed protein product [Rotaria socialis]CAF3364872.1 unnamed protein product [Rotaria socialis]CAF3529049.1 unnamed protein product [Rotaria socialis]CAF4206944.1 unnamed protein product [Rotaria socialis]CAF4685965.1 unnamed protein product [Rotaria socialis]